MLTVIRTTTSVATTALTIVPSTAEGDEVVAVGFVVAFLHSSSLNEDITMEQVMSTFNSWACTKTTAPEDTHASKKVLILESGSEGDSLMSARNVTAVGDPGKHLKPALVIRPTS